MRWPAMTAFGPPAPLDNFDVLSYYVYHDALPEEAFLRAGTSVAQKDLAHREARPSAFR